MLRFSTASIAAQLFAFVVVECCHGPTVKPSYCLQTLHVPPNATAAGGIGNTKQRERRFNDKLIDAAPIKMEETQFILFNKKNMNGTRFFVWDPTSLQNAKFDPNKRTVINAHGFRSGRNRDSQIALRTAHLKNLDVNYIVVDWSACAKVPYLLYPIAMLCCKKVGSFVAESIRFLNEHGLKLRDVQLIGHSLGAHTMAQVSNFGITTPRITGLDPTQVGFWPSRGCGRLDPSDADYVDIIHTNAILLGWIAILGHTDFFANGIGDQPKCSFLDESCNHAYAVYYYAESLYNQTRFPAQKCKGFLEADFGVCHGPVTYMGIKSIEGPRGIFSINTEKIDLTNVSIPA